MAAPDQFTQYPEIRNLPDVPEILAVPEVIVTEKIHGSNMRIGWINETVRLGGRRLEFTDLRPDTREGLGFISWVLRTGLDQRVREAAVGHQVTFYGEWYGSGTPAQGWPQIQKGIRYFAGNNFRIFDVRCDGKYVPFDEIAGWAARIGLGTMPVLYRGRPEQAIFDGFIDTESRLAQEHGIHDPANTMEGIVIRPPTTQWSSAGEIVMAKYKIGKWAERASEQRHPRQPKAPKAPPPPGAEAFAVEFVTTTRLEHVLDQLREAGIAIDKTAVPHVLRGMGQDIKREGARALEAAGLEWKDVTEAVTRRSKACFLECLASHSS